MRSCRPFCCGLPGLMRSMSIPSRSHHTESLVRPKRELALAKGAPLSASVSVPATVRDSAPASRSDLRASAGLLQTQNAIARGGGPESRWPSRGSRLGSSWREVAPFVQDCRYASARGTRRMREDSVRPAAPMTAALRSNYLALVAGFVVPAPQVKALSSQALFSFCTTNTMCAISCIATPLCLKV